MAAETICPSCGYGPLDDVAEDCPKCSTHFAANPLYKRARAGGGQFVRKDSDDLEATKTTLGGAKSAVEHHPLPAAGLLIGSTFGWVLRAMGVLSDRPEPWWPLGLAALQMGVAMMLVVSAGPGKELAQMLALAQIAVAFFAGGPTFAQLGFAGVGVALLVITVGEPSGPRRWVGTGAGAAMLLFGIWAAT